jgi:hypothetical protein
MAESDNAEKIRLLKARIRNLGGDPLEGWIREYADLTPVYGRKIELQKQADEMAASRQRQIEKYEAEIISAETKTS